MPDGQEVELFCKYSGREFDSCHGHRGSVAYEAEVYRHLLVRTNVASPRFIAAGDIDGEGQTCLVLEALADVERTTEDVAPEAALVKAAGEIGAFHAAVARLCGDRWPSFLRRYDRDYYVGWIRRTSLYAGAWHERFPWLARLCERAEAMMDPLLAAKQTVIHGELYPHNILCGGGRVYLIDWQSTAVAAGEIDLATLTEKWPDEMVQQCEQAYRSARWPDGAPVAFEPTLAAARLYLVFRWLGDRPEWTMKARSEWGFEQLRKLAEHLGLING